MDFAVMRDTDLRLSRICLGTPEYGSSISRLDSFDLMDSYVEMGGNFLDTAHIYADWQCETPGMSELTLGAWVAERKCREQIVIGTKGGSCTPACPIPRLAPEQITGDLKLGLARLRFDYVDLYWLHRDDPTRPVSELMDTLDGLRKQGLIRWYAASNWSAARLREAAQYAARKGIPSFVASQIQWSLAKMNPAAVWDQTMLEMDEETLRFHIETGLPQVPFTSQARGFFSGAYFEDRPETGKPAVREAYGSELNWGRLARARALSRELGCTPNQMALAYLMSQPFQCFPIVGARRVEQLKDSCGAADLRLTPEQVRILY
jgi:aryl-alcohol dehydrogenase-like predicted oxidoreductase